jgi:hypothetical protein
MCFRHLGLNGHESTTIALWIRNYFVRIRLCNSLLILIRIQAGSDPDFMDARML